MSLSYLDIKKLNGKKCFTLTQNKPAQMRVDDIGVTIVYPSGNGLDIPRSKFEEALHLLNAHGVLKMEEVHERITNGNGAMTDRLLAVLREIPETRYTSSPRAIYLKKG